MHYTVCTDFPANKLGRAKKLCITHYDIMHYEKVYCNLFVCLIIYPKYNINQLAFKYIPIELLLHLGSSMIVLQVEILVVRKKDDFTTSIFR